MPAHCAADGLRPVARSRSPSAVWPIIHHAATLATQDDAVADLQRIGSGLVNLQTRHDRRRSGRQGMANRRRGPEYVDDDDRVARQLRRLNEIGKQMDA